MLPRTRERNSPFDLRIMVPEQQTPRQCGIKTANTDARSYGEERFENFLRRHYN